MSSIGNFTLIDGRNALDAHVAECAECRDEGDDPTVDHGVLCPEAQKLFHQVVALEEERLGVKALGEEDEVTP